MDIIRNLPLEIAQHIILFLNPDDIDNIWNIQQWRYVFNNHLWKKLCNRSGYQNEEDCPSLDNSMLELSPDWQAIYKYHRLASNWKDGKFKCIAIKKTHYFKILYFDDEIIALKATSHNVCNDHADIINVSTGKIIFTLNVNTRILNIKKHQDWLIILIHGALKVWNLNSKSWILNNKFEASHFLGDGKIHLEASYNLLAFVNSVHCIFIFNMETQELCFEDSAVEDVSFGDNFIILLSLISSEIKVLDLNCKLLMSINYSDMDVDIGTVMTKSGYILFCTSIADQHYRKVSVHTVQATKSLQEINAIDVSYEKIFYLNNDTIVFVNSWLDSLHMYDVWKFASENEAIGIGSCYDSVLARNDSCIFTANMEHSILLTGSKTQFARAIKVISMVDFKVTDKKLAYLTCDGSLCIQNYDFSVE